MDESYDSKAEIVNHLPLCFVFANNLSASAYTNTMLQSAYELARRGHRVILVTANHYARASAEDNPAVYVWPSKRPTKWRDFIFLNQLITQFHPDCLVTDGYASSNVMLIVGWLRGVHLRVTWYHTLRAGVRLQTEMQHGWEYVRDRGLILRKYIVWKVTSPHFIANTELAKRDVQGYLHINNTRVFAFRHLLVDPKHRVTSEVVDDRHRFVCVGRLSREKSQDTLIQAVASLKTEYPETVVEFIGDGPCRSEYEQMAQALGVKRHCLFLGRLDHGCVLDKMASAYALVLPSLSESFGLVNIEAMSVGTPVVASRVGGIPEIVRDGVDGLLFSPGDHAELSDKMRSLLASTALRNTMSQNARKRFEENYEMERNIGELANWFERKAGK